MEDAEVRPCEPAGGGMEDAEVSEEPCDPTLSDAERKLRYLALIQDGMEPAEVRQAKDDGGYEDSRITIDGVEFGDLLKQSAGRQLGLRSGGSKKRRIKPWHARADELYGQSDPNRPVSERVRRIWTQLTKEGFSPPGESALRRFLERE
jgi:hypothetical protein